MWYYVGWKSTVSQKLVVFTMWCTLIDAKLIIAINHSILWIFQKSKMH
jgi:hypothetical protein